MKININYPLKKHNTFGLNIIADEFVEFHSLKELRDIFKYIKKRKWYVLGGGSNTLFVDDFHGVVIHGADKCIEVVGEDDNSVTVRVSAGVNWDDFVSWSVENGFYGIENLSLIPGCVGASPVQNIGAYGVEAKDFITRVEFYIPSSDSVSVLNNSQCRFGYRDSIFKNDLRNDAIVLNVDYTLSMFFKPNLSYGNLSSVLDGLEENLTAKQLRDAIIKIREDKLPNPDILGNCGSFFKNPIVTQQVAASLLAMYPNMPHYDDVNGVKIPAGWLIEQCGWKGKSLGQAAVHENQALVIVNLGYAKPKEIIDIADNIIADVEIKFNIKIEPELNYI